MKVPVSTPELTEKDREAVANCIDSGWVSGTAPIVGEFEEAFAEYCGVSHGVVTGSGTTALHLALAALNIGKGDEVIMPSFSMIASANAVHYLGGKPVFADIEPDTWCIDPADIEAKITDNTKAIMPVHVYGHPCDMGAITEISFAHDLDVIEDCAEAHGAEYKRKKVGWFGRANCFSFYANKIITTGEGGIIVTEDFEVAERANWLRAHAFGRQGKHYWHEEIGYGYRMSALQAALGLSQLERLDYYVEKRRQASWMYRSLLHDLKEDGLISFPVEREGYKNVHWMFSIVLAEGNKRQLLIQHLADREIETRTFFYPIHQLPVYETGEKLPVTEDIAYRGMNLPSGNSLTKAQIRYVCEAILEFFA